jgi:hypothetical protein
VLKKEQIMADWNPKPSRPPTPGVAGEPVPEGDFCGIEPGQSGHASAAGSTAQKARESAGRTAQQAGARGKELAGDMADKIQTKLYDLLEQEKNRATDRLASFSHAIQEACENVEDENARALISYAKSGAEQVERASHSLHDRNLRDMGDDVTRFARKQPELFLGASFLTGIVLARAIKSTWAYEKHEGVAYAHAQTQAEPGVERGPGPVGHESTAEGPGRPPV